MSNNGGERVPDAPKPKGAATVGPESGDEREGTSAELPRWVTPAIVALVVGGSLFYLWLVFTRWGVADKWGNFGGAVGPFVGLLNAGALFAALYSVRLQRRELELQRQELRETREEMVEQRKQFEKTAAAQERLADSQEQLARAQRDAVREATAMRLATCSATVAGLRGTLVQIGIDRAKLTSTPFESAFNLFVNEKEGEARDHLDRAIHAEDTLRELVATGKF